VSLAGARKGFEVIDRGHLRVILQENKLAATGLIDPSTARKLGQIAGVDALITGTITPFGDTIRVTVKVLDASTAGVVGSVRGNIAKTQAIEELLTTEVRDGKKSMDAREPGNRQSKSLSENIPPQTINGFLFELERCEQAGGGLVCNLFITNTKATDRHLRLMSESSRIVDDSGEEYPAREMQIGRQGNQSVVAALASGVRMRAAVFFEGLPPKFGGIALLEIHCGEGHGFSLSSRTFYLQFRNISL